MARPLTARVRALRKWLAGLPPPGPFHGSFWRSPIRGPWLTAVLSTVLLVGFVVVPITGLVSYAAYNPGLQGGWTDLTPDKGILGFYLFPWPTRPVWLYWLNQSVHVILGLVLIPVLLAKLWSVLPKLFEWPVTRSVVHAAERVSLLLLVASSIFEIVTGVINIQYLYAFPGSFYRLHLYGGWVFIAAFAAHVGIKIPALVRALRSRSLRRELRKGVGATDPEPREAGELVSPNPAPATISRRGALGLVGAGSLTMLAVTLGQTLGGLSRVTAVLAPRGRLLGHGPNDFQVNKTAEFKGITPAMVGREWQLELRGAVTRQLSYEDLLAMPQHDANLPIACVEGWSTGVQHWSGVRLRDLAGLVDAANAFSVLVESLEDRAFSSAALRGNQIRDPLSLLALRVNGATISLDHGYPARVIVPAAPGVHNTKWVTRMSFRPQELDRP